MIMALRQWSKKLNILFLTKAHNSMSQRAMLELNKQNHRVTVELATSDKAILMAKEKTKPDLIICPFLTRRIPAEIYQDKKVPCLIVHPGVQGDRGSSSIDWALKEKLDTWGVTVLQACEEMDAGDIWSSKTFPMKRRHQETITKSSLYKNEVVETAMKCITEAIEKFTGNVKPIPLDYNASKTIGTLQPTMKQGDRSINWNDSVSNIVSRIRFSDSQPGVKIQLHGKNYFAFNACEDVNTFSTAIDRSEHGTIVGHRHQAIAVKAKDGLVWLGSLKNTRSKIKLPAAMALPHHIMSGLETLPNPPVPQHSNRHPLAFPVDGFQEIWTNTHNGICYVHFNFYNGACGTDQCKRLTYVLNEIKDNKDITCVVLMGGYDAFSNGIHLNVIENSDDPELESKHNINAINDVIRTIFTMSDKVTVSALQGNAGAGGVMMALASDYIIAHKGVVLNPHYRLMGLHGSEYWTHFLPEKVGVSTAATLTESKAPISASLAKEINIINELLGDNVEDFRKNLIPHLERKFLDSNNFHSIIANKKKKLLDDDWTRKVIEARNRELEVMYQNFKSNEYNFTRTQFVRKINAIATPTHLPGFKPRAMDVAGLQRKVLKDIMEKVNGLVEAGHIPHELSIFTSGNDMATLETVQDRISQCMETGMKSTNIHFFGDHGNLQSIMRSLATKGMVESGTVVDGVYNHSYLEDIEGNIPYIITNVCVPKAVLRLLLEHGVQLFDQNITILGSKDTTWLKPLEETFVNECAHVSLFSEQGDKECARHSIQNTDILLLDADLATYGVERNMLKKNAVVMNLRSMESRKLSNAELFNGAKLFLGPVDSVEPIIFCMFLEQLVLSEIKRLEMDADVKLQIKQLQ